MFKKLIGLLILGFIAMHLSTGCAYQPVAAEVGMAAIAPSASPEITTNISLSESMVTPEAISTPMLTSAPSASVASTAKPIEELQKKKADPTKALTTHKPTATPKPSKTPSPAPVKTPTPTCKPTQTPTPSPIQTPKPENTPKPEDDMKVEGSSYGKKVLSGVNEVRAENGCEPLKYGGSGSLLNRCKEMAKSGKLQAPKGSNESTSKSNDGGKSMGIFSAVHASGIGSGDYTTLYVASVVYNGKRWTIVRAG